MYKMLNLVFVHKMYIEMKYRSCTYAITTQKKRIERIQQQQYIFYYFYCKSTVHRAWATYTCLRTRGYGKKATTTTIPTKKRTPNIFFAIVSTVFYQIHTQTKKKNTHKWYESDKDRVEWKTDEKRGTYNTDRIRIRFSRRIYVASVDRIQHGHCPQ